MAEPATSRRFTKALAEFATVPDPLARLNAVRLAREAVDALEQDTVIDARAAGATWSDIGALYGVSKQAAQQRFRRPPAKADAAPEAVEPRSPRDAVPATDPGDATGGATAAALAPAGAVQPKKRARAVHRKREAALTSDGKSDVKPAGDAHA